MGGNYEREVVKEYVERNGSRGAGKMCSGVEMEGERKAMGSGDGLLHAVWRESGRGG